MTWDASDTDRTATDWKAAATAGAALSVRAGLVVAPAER